MNAFYRTVYFRPRLALDWRVPVAAMLSLGGKTETVSAALLPDTHCLGSPGASELLHFGMTTLVDARRDALPSSLGPHFEIGPREELPGTVRNPARWVQKTALPWPRHSELDTGIAAAKRIPTQAWNHLSKWGVSAYVRKRFRPQDAPELSRLPPKVGTITHFVLGHDTVLLMEPIALSASEVSKRVATIYSKFSAYSHAWDATGGRHHQMVAYVLPGAHTQDDLEQFTYQLNSVASVFNTGRTQSRQKFTETVRQIGDTGPRPELVS